MDGFRVFLRGQVNIEQALAVLEGLRPVEVLSGPVGPVDVFCIRDGLLIEFHHDHQDPDFPLLIRFIETDRCLGRAWVAAHAFLWAVTRRAEVDEALLTGPDTEPLRFREGHIRPAPAPEERYPEDA